jgi:DNA processing protein
MLENTLPPLHPSLAKMPVLDVLRLIRSENVGAITFFQLIRRYGTAAQALEMLPELAARGGKRKFTVYSKQDAEAEREKAQQFGATILLYGQPDYPALLTQVVDAPPLLMLRGSPHHWHERRLVAMVGSRNASAAGCSLTRKLAADCGNLGFTVVSGLARGIDAAAHQGALATGTVGVIAGGIDTLYPPENKMLYEKMAESGAILTEQPFGSAPHARSFPSRNRIIAGMCEGLLVVEAAPKSGSLISATYALEQGREVMAIPGSPLDPRSQGTNGLIKQGAALIESAEDIRRALEQPVHRSHTPYQALQLQEENSTGYAALTNFSEPSSEELAEARIALLSALSPVPVLLDAVIRETQLPPAILQVLILELELAGIIQRSTGGRIALCYGEGKF